MAVTPTAALVIVARADRGRAVAVAAPSTTTAVPPHRFLRLHTVFYDYLQASQGEVSALEFAMAAHVTGQQARAFLDARARDFWADFEPTPQGDVLYRFPMRSPAPHHRPADPK
jgi:hypothetical protein